jgi:hypothetical protein
MKSATARMDARELVELHQITTKRRQITNVLFNNLLEISDRYWRIAKHSMFYEADGRRTAAVNCRACCRTDGTVIGPLLSN